MLRRMSNFSQNELYSSSVLSSNGGSDTITKESSFGALKFDFRNSQDYVVVLSFYVMTVPFKVVLQH